MEHSERCCDLRLNEGLGGLRPEFLDQLIHNAFRRGRRWRGTLVMVGDNRPDDIGRDSLRHRVDGGPWHREAVEDFVAR